MVSHPHRANKIALPYASGYLRTAICNHLDAHAEVVKQTLSRKEVALSLQHYTRRDLENSLSVQGLLCGVWCWVSRFSCSGVGVPLPSATSTTKQAATNAFPHSPRRMSSQHHKM